MAVIRLVCPYRCIVSLKIDTLIKENSFQELNFWDNNYEYVNTIIYGTGENTIFNEWYTLVDHIGKNYGIPQSLISSGYFDK